MTTDLYWESDYVVSDITPINVSSSQANINNQIGVNITPISISASGGSGAGYQYFANGLPAGLYINNSSGVIYGIPQSSGSGVIYIVVVDSANNASNSLLIDYVIYSNIGFTWLPSQAPIKSVKPNVYSAKFGDGYEQNSPKGINFQPATWSLQFTGTTATIKEIDKFLESQGGYLKFLWIPPDSNTELLWICREWQPKYMPGGTGTLSASFIQEFGA
jgi:phage-related protein